MRLVMFYSSISNWKSRVNSGIPAIRYRKGLADYFAVEVAHGVRRWNRPKEPNGYCRKATAKAAMPHRLCRRMPKDVTLSLFGPKCLMRVVLHA